MDVSPEALRLTLDEMEEIEALVEAPASKWEDVSQAKMMKAMVFVLRKRTNPKTKMEDVGKLCVADIDAELAPFAGGSTAVT